MVVVEKSAGAGGAPAVRVGVGVPAPDGVGVGAVSGQGDDPEQRDQGGNDGTREKVAKAGDGLSDWVSAWTVYLPRW